MEFVNSTSIIQGFFDGIRPNKIQTVTEWADENVYITSASGASEPGKYSHTRTPYIKDIQDDLSPHSPIQKVVFMKGVQIAGSQAGLNAVGTYIAISPCSIMYVMPTLATIKKLSKTKLKDLIEHCDILRKKISRQRERDGDNTIFYKEFDGGFITLTGCNSAAELRSATIRVLILDEVDAFPVDLDSEGSPVELAEGRMTTYGDKKKEYMLSTPLIKGQSIIETEYEDTDQRKYFIPCPFCNHKQHLVIENLKWEPGKYNHVVYICESCFMPIEERYKTQFLKLGEWMPTCPDKISSIKRGYHLNSLYSPLGWMGWPHIARSFEKAQKDINKLRAFTNIILAQTFAETGDSPDWEELYKLREPYPFNVVPNEVAFLTCGVDIQADRIELEIVGWCYNKISYSIDYRVLTGRTSEMEVWGQLENVINEKWKRVDGSYMQLSMTCVDSSYNGTMVYVFCNSMGLRTVPVRGYDNQRTITKHPSQIDVNYEGKKIGTTKLWNIGVSLLKSEIYGFLKLKKNEDGTYPYGYCHFPEYPENFFKMITAEELRFVTNKKGQQVQEWFKPSGKRNEALDTRNYARAAATIVGIDQMEKHHFDEMINSYGKIEKPNVKPVIKPNKFWDK